MHRLRCFRNVFSAFMLTTSVLSTSSASPWYINDAPSHEAVVFVTSANSCQSACNVSMHNVVSIIGRHASTRKIPARVFVTDVRKSSAKYFSDELGFPLQDSLPPLMRTLSRGMQQPVAIITATDERYLVIDALTQKKSEMLDSLIGAFLRNSRETNTESYLTSTALTSVDMFEITHVQALSDSLMLCFDGMRGEAGIVDIHRDSLVHHARLPKQIAEQFRNDKNSEAWDQYVQMGVKMTQVQLAYAPSETSNDVVLAFSQMYFKSEEERQRDTGMAKQVDLRGRLARWVSRSSNLHGSRLDPTDTARVSRIGLIGLAPQRIGGVSIFSGGTKDYYSSNPDSQYVATYADDTGEHLLIPRSRISHPDSAFNIRGYTFISAMLDGKVMISHPRNSIFGLYDTVKQVLTTLRPYGPLALLCNSQTFEKRVSGYIGPDFLVDTSARHFISVSYAAIEPKSTRAPFGVVINVYDVDTGDHLYSKAFNTTSDLSVFRFKAFNIVNNVLYAISQNDNATSLVKIRL